MRKFVIGFLLGAMLFGTVGYAATTYIAEPASFKVLVNGEEFVSDPPALVVEGRTYLPLRAMGEAIGVPVEWNAELGRAEVGTTPQKEITPDYATYKESNDIIDFGKLYGVDVVDVQYIDDSNAIAYLYNSSDVATEDAVDYLSKMEHAGYTVKDEDDYLMGINYEDLKKDHFTISFKTDTDTSKQYFIVMVVKNVLQ